MIHPAFDHRIGAWLAVFLKQVTFQRPCVDADADRTIIVPRGLDHLFDALFVADIAGVDPQTGGPRLGGFDSAFVVEMDIRHDRHRYLAHDLFQRLGAFDIRHRHTHDIGPHIGSSLNLRNRRFDIRRQRVRHRLHRDRRIAPDRHIPHHDLTGLPAVNVAPRANVIEGHAKLPLAMKQSKGLSGSVRPTPIQPVALLQWYPAYSVGEVAAFFSSATIVASAEFSSSTAGS